MFIELLRFADNKSKAGDYMEGHKAWLSKGFEDDVFLCAGSLQPGAGGALVAHNTSLEELEARIRKDPFVAEKVAKPEILEISLAKSDKRLDFLVD